MAGQAVPAGNQITLEQVRTWNRRGQCRPWVPGHTYLGTGARIDEPSPMPRDGRPWPILIEDAERSGHMGCFGTTRVGKTRLLESLIAQDIHKGYSVLILDPKGDHELFNRVVQEAVTAGRLDEVMLLTLIFPDYSIQVGPFKSFSMQDELVNLIIGSIKTKEDYYVAVAQEVSQAIIAGVLLERDKRHDRTPLTFADVLARIGFEDLKGLATSLRQYPDTAEIVRAIDRMVSSPNLVDFWSKVSSSLRTTLSALTFGATGTIMGRATANPVIDRLEANQPVIVVAHTGALLTQRTSVVVGKVLLSMIQSLVGRLFSSGKRLEPPLCLHIDEGHNVLYLGFQELINKGGGANCWVHFYTQSLSQIEAEVGRDVAKSIVDNINTWIYLLVNHPETARHVEETAPERIRQEPVLDLDGGTFNWRTVREPAIKRAKVLQLPKRWFYCRSYGRVWKGMTPTVAETWLKVQWPVIRPYGVAAPPESGPEAAGPPAVESRETGAPNGAGGGLSQGAAGSPGA